VIPRRSPIALTVEYAADLHHVRQWAAFTESLRIEATPDLGVVIDKISRIRIAARDCCGKRATIQPAMETSKSVAASQVTPVRLTTPCFHFVVRIIRDRLCLPTATTCARSAEYETR